MQFHAFSGIRVGAASANVKPHTIAERVSRMKGVKAAHVVTGSYDIMTYVEIDDLKALKDLLYEIHDIPGVHRTETWIELR